MMIIVLVMHAISIIFKRNSLNLLFTLALAVVHLLKLE